MEEITERYAGLHLSLKEDAEVIIQEPVPEEGLVLLGKFYTKRRVNLESVARVLKSVWKTEATFEVSDLGENKVMFLFQKKDDMDRVLFLSPWSFDKYLLVLHKLAYGEAVQDIKFDRTPFWIQIHGLPTMCQTKTVGMSIGATLGEVEKVDANGSGFRLGSFLRIRVQLDITKPLCRGRKVRLGEHGMKWVEFKYERLPIFCYLCGMIDHDERDCLQGFRSKETPRPEEKQFGPWLRANPDKHQKTVLITAGKYGESRNGEVEPETMARRWNAEPTEEGGTTRIDGLGKAEHSVEVRADVVNVDNSPDQLKIKIPNISLRSNFETEIQAIDAAIMGDVSAVNDEPIKDLIMGREEITLTQKDSRLDSKGRNCMNGPNLQGLQPKGVIGPQEQLMEMNDRPGVDLGLNPSNISFKLGPTSPKSLKLKKATEGGQKKNKGNRGGVETRKDLDRECMQRQGVDSGIERSMEVDQTKMGLKRRVRSPSHEVENFDGSGKRAKLEGEVREFGKMLAHHLGSAEAGNQPRRTQ